MGRAPRPRHGGADRDLVHARLVLEHLPQRDAVVAKLVAALRPGGWLVIDDYDLCTIGVVDPPHAAWSATADATVAVLRAAGVDPYYGSKLLGVLRSAGLVDVDAEGLVRPRLLPDLAPDSAVTTSSVARAPDNTDHRDA
ncbi:MAG TPA: hypothetical protein VFP06_00375 [Acidimicrobiales bacterium]|nr:hypothetical protein [Acidimicrobiales bacterium]